MSSTNLAFVAALGGTVVGSLITIATTITLNKPQTTPTGAASAPVSELESIQKRLDAYERSVQQVHVAATVRKGALHDSTSGTDPADKPVNVNDTLASDDEGSEIETPAQLRARFGEKIDAHRREPRDQAWASRAETTMRDDLAKLVTSTGYQLMRVDCRSVTCVVGLVWPDATSAQKTFEQIMRYPMQIDCAREIVLPEPSPGTQEVNVLFDCAGARSNEQVR